MIRRHRIVLCLAMLSAAGCLAKKDEPTQVVSSTTTPEEKPWVDPPRPPTIDKKEANRAGLNEFARHENIRVRVTRVRIDNVQMIDAIGRTKRKSAKKMLIVDVETENVSDSKKMTYLPWATSVGYRDKDKATLSDDHGNTYHQSGTGLLSTTTFEGQADADSLYPGKLISDVLVFEEPVGKATILDLDLPGLHCGVSGTFKFRLEAKDFRPIAKPDPAPLPPPSPTPGNQTSVDSRATRIWLADQPAAGDEANVIEDDRGPAAADAFAEEKGGLRSIARGATVIVIEAGNPHSKVRWEEGTNFKFGWVNNKYLKKSVDLSPKPKRPSEEPVPEPKPKGPTEAEQLAARKAIYIKVATAIAEVEAAAAKKFKEGTIPHRNFLDSEIPKALNKLVMDLGQDRETINSIRSEGDQKKWPKK